MKLSRGVAPAWLAHLLGVQEVGRSNRLAPTTSPKQKFGDRIIHAKIEAFGIALIFLTIFLIGTVRPYLLNPANHPRYRRMPDAI